MLRFLKQFILRWTQRQFHDNPLVTAPADYLAKLGQAYYIWLLAVTALVGLALLGSVGFVIGTLHGWF